MLDLLEFVGRVVTFAVTILLGCGIIIKCAILIFAWAVK